MSTQNPKGSTKKKAAALLLAVAVMISAVAGTFAYRDYSQHKTNEFSDKIAKYDVTLVEDFQEKEDWKTSDGEITKEISVKNTGDKNDDRFEELYVRLQLKEYMDLTPMIVEKTPDLYMLSTAGDFIVFATEAEAKTAYPDHVVKNLTDAVGNKTGWFVQTKEKDDNGQYGKKVTTKYEFGAKQFVVGDASMEDARKDVQKIKAHDAETNKECAYPTHEWENVDLTKVLAQPGAAEYIKWNLGSDVMLLSDWNDSSNAKYHTYGPFWIIDDRATGDGWAYWAEALYPGDSTAKFLESVELIKQPNGDFYYAIHTEMEAVSLDELFGEFPQWPGAPSDWKESIKTNAPQVILDLTGVTTSIKMGQTVAGPVVTVKPDTLADKTVTYKSSNPAVASVDADGNVTGKTPGTTTITVTAANGEKATYTVTVTNDKTKLRELQDLIEDAKKLDENDYTPESWTDANLDGNGTGGAPGVIADAESKATADPVLDDGVLDAMIDELQGAMDDLVAKSTTKDTLQAAIDDAKTLLDYDNRDLTDDRSVTGDGAANIYNTDYLDELQNEVDAAIAVIEDASSSESDLATALGKLEDLLSAPVLKANTGDLGSLVITANGLEETDYTTDSWGDLATALGIANGLVNNPAATQGAVDSAKAALQTAIDDLVLRGNAGALNTLIQNAVAEENKGIPTNETFTADSYQALKDALDTTGRTTPVDVSNMSAEDVAALVAELQPAYEGLVDISGLKAVVDEANGKTAADYSNWNTVMNTPAPGRLADAIAVLGKADATQTEVTDAKNALAAALTELTVAGTLSDLQAAVSGAEDSDDYTSASWTASGYGAKLAEIQGMITALGSNPSAHTPSEIAAVISELATAKTGLVLRADPTALINARANATTGLTEVDYTSSTWGNLQTAIAAGGAIANASTPWPDRSVAEQDTLIAGITTAKDALVDISALTNAITAGIAKTGTPTASTTDWNNAGAYNTSLAAAQSIIAAGTATQADVDAAATDLLAKTAALTLKPTVTGFTVAASGAGTQAATASNFTVNLTKSAAAQTVTLTGAQTGTNLSANSTSWTPSGSNSSWGTAAGDANTYVVTVPANAVGAVTVTAKAKDDPTKTVVITINVTNVTRMIVDYSSYNTSYYGVSDITESSSSGAAINNFDHGSDTVATASRIWRSRVTGGTNLDTKWTIVSQTGTGAAWNTVTGGTNFLDIPANYEGTISVKVESDADATWFTTFDVVVEKAPVIASAGRELTAAQADDNSKWIEVATKDGYSLIVRGNNLPAVTGYTATHVFGTTNNYIGSNVQGHINTWYAGTETGTLSSLKAKAVTHNALSRLGTTMAKVDDGFSSPTTTVAGAAADTAFALSSGEAIRFMSRYNYSQLVSTQTDRNGQQTWTNWNALSTKSHSWLRSPGSTATDASALTTTGVVTNSSLTNSNSVRPALWVKSDIFD